MLLLLGPFSLAWWPDTMGRWSSYPARQECLLHPVWLCTVALSTWWRRWPGDHHRARKAEVTFTNVTRPDRCGRSSTGPGSVWAWWDPQVWTPRAMPMLWVAPARAAPPPGLPPLRPSASSPRRWPGMWSSWSRPPRPISTRYMWSLLWLTNCDLWILNNQQMHIDKMKIIKHFYNLLLS